MNSLAARVGLCLVRCGLYSCRMGHAAAAQPYTSHLTATIRARHPHTSTRNRTAALHTILFNALPACLPVVVLATAAAVCALLPASRAASTTVSTTSLACGQHVLTQDA